jgi:hypothetical protein
MLSCRSVQVEIRGSSVRMLVNQGCLQRGLLSPLLWNMVYFVYSIMHIIRRRVTLMMWFCCKMASRVPSTASRTGVGLSVNANKTKMVLFTNNRKIGGFYNHIYFLVRSLIGIRILQIGYAKPALHNIGSVVVL